MTRKGQSITLSISERDKQQLIELAKEHGMTWGDEPNISRLVKAIAQRELKIERNHDWSQDRIQALQQAMKALIDSGQTEPATTIAQLLLERSELTLPLRQELEQMIHQPISAWRSQIDQFIRQEQPFQLAYRDAADRLLTFSIRFAQVKFREKRHYLECWCEETEGNHDIPALHHNWTLRLDRISEAAVSRLSGKWKSGLDTIEVEMQLSGGLAFAYQSRPADRSVEWESGIKIVKRQTSSTFWLLREILPYGKDCVIVAPDTVRDRVRSEIAAMFAEYNDFLPE
ncbi:MAG: WYL domain-containing protein [Leptolyngbya sp. Prado105]|jgi:predicted DNA-binding transcriptional regulator YafY|nr:WYL domain-containing protein [Leptolyngbya sp. Prado105]